MSNLCPSLLQPLKNNKFRIFKSRYDSIDSYLSSCGDKYNDIDLTIDNEIYEQLLAAGECEGRGELSVSFLWQKDKCKITDISTDMTKITIKIFFFYTGIDRLLAQHIAHLFIRDPLTVFEEKIHLDDENESDHFEVKV